MIIALLNIIILFLSLLIFSFLYTISLQPVKRTDIHGEKAWKQCRNLRSAAGLFEFISIFNYIIWIWFPFSPFDTWIINENILIGIFISICILFPCIVINPYCGYAEILSSWVSQLMVR